VTVIPRPNENAENRLLAALPADEYARLRPQLEEVKFSKRWNVMALPN